MNRIFSHIECEVSEYFCPDPIPSAAAIGTFDGLHLGHRMVMETLLAEAKARHLRPLVFSFSCHPLAVVDPSRAPAMLMTPTQRSAQLLELGVQPVCVDFTTRVMRLTARQWLEILHRDFGVSLLILGYDNTFGSDGHTLSHSQIAEIAARLGIDTVVAPCVDGASSSKARKALAEGKPGEAARILGHHYTLWGTVAEGNRIGRTIGFPTANLEPDKDLVIPAHGVYAALALLPDGRQLPAMVNIGNRPTLGPGLKPTIEAHILDFNGNLYHKPLGIKFLSKLRDERKFSDLNHLTQQLKKDCTLTRQLFEI